MSGEAVLDAGAAVGGAGLQDRVAGGGQPGAGDDVGVGQQQPLVAAAHHRGAAAQSRGENCKAYNFLWRGPILVNK